MRARENAREGPIVRKCRQEPRGTVARLEERGAAQAEAPPARPQRAAMAPPAWTRGAAVRSVSGSVWGGARHSCSGLLCRGAGCPVRRVLPRPPGTSGAARAPSYDALEGRRRRCRPVRRRRRGRVCRRACPWARRAGTSERTGSPHQRVKLDTSTPPTVFFCSTAIFFCSPLTYYRQWPGAADMPRRGFLLT